MKTLYLTTALILLTVLNSAAQKHTITQTGFTFSPQNLTVGVGDTILWQWTSGAHTTTSVSVPAGAEEWNSPLNNTSTQFQYIVTVPGTYQYVCVPHQSMGMNGSFTAEGTTGSELQKTTASFPAASPFAGQLFISPGTSNSGTAIMYNLTGTVCLKSTVKGYTFIDTESLPDGIYVLEIRYTDGKTVRQKIVKRND